MGGTDELMPEGVHHYDESSEMPENIQKFVKSIRFWTEHNTDESTDTGINATISGLVTMKASG
jgi:phage host-nuclease inhibitor protein Gam